MKARFNVIERNAFLRTILPKSSTKGQFLPLQIRKLEQLVPLLAVNDHFVPKKHQGTFRFHQKEHTHTQKKPICSRFSRRDRSQIKKGNGSEKQNVLKNSASQKGKKPTNG